MIAPECSGQGLRKKGKDLNAQNEWRSESGIGSIFHQIQSIGAV